MVFYFNKKRKEKGSISPNILYQHQQDFQQLNYGFYFKYGIVVGGLVGFGAGMGASALGRALNTQSFENVDATQVAANTAVVAAASLGIIGAMA